MEHKMKCNVCGNVFCYTDEDLKQNALNAGLSALGAIGSLSSTLGGGTIFHTQYLTGQSDRYSDKIVDYNQCPYCHSRDLSPYTGETQPTAGPATVAEIPQKTISINSSAAPESLLKRAFLFLEDGDWATADAYCDACLDQDPELARAYLAKLMVEFKIHTVDELEQCSISLSKSKNYQKVLRFGEKSLVEKLEKCNLNVKKNSSTLAEIRKRLNDPDCSVMVAISGDGHVAAIDANGTIQTSGRPLDGWNNPYPPEDWHDLVYIDLDFNNIAGLRSDGTVVAYGKDNDSHSSILGNAKNISADALSWKNVKAISMGGNVLMGLCYDGKVLTSGDGGFDLREVSTWKNIIQISSKDDAMFGLCENGTVKYCGKYKDSSYAAIPSITNACRIKSLESGLAVFYPNGRAEVVSNKIMEGTSSWSDIIDVVGNSFEMAAGLKNNGTIVTSKTSYYYEKNYGQGDLEGWTNIVELYNSMGCSVGLKADGTVVGCGQKDFGSLNVSDWKNIVSIKESKYGYITVGICADGSVVSCGQFSMAGQEGIKIDTSNMKLFNSLEDLDKNIARNKAKRLAAEAEAKRELAEKQKQAEEQRQLKIKELEQQKASLQAEAANVKGLLASIKKSKLESQIAEIDSKLFRAKNERLD